jgi:hypothetical protein
MQQHCHDVLIFPQVSAEIASIFETTDLSVTTVSEINIAGLPRVTVPAAGQFKERFGLSLILIDAMRS